MANARRFSSLKKLLNHRHRKNSRVGHLRFGESSRHFGFEVFEPRSMLAASLGPEIHINSTTSLDQYAPRVDADAAGNSVTVWHGVNPRGYGTNDVFFQRLNSLGTPIGPETSVNPDWHGEQVYPDVAVAPDGRFAVVYESPDGDGQGIFLRRFDATGAPVADPVQVHANSAGNQTLPRVGISDSGSLIVIWQDDARDGSSLGVYGRRFDAVGNPSGPEFRANTTTANEQGNPDVAMAGSGQFVIVWHDSAADGNGYGVFGQRFDASGVTVGNEFQINTETNSHQWFPSVASGSDGRFVATWQSYQDGSDQGIYAQRFAVDGTPAGSEFQVNTVTNSTQSSAHVAFASDDTFAVAWQSYQDGSDQGVYVQQYDATGAEVGSEVQLNTYTNSTQAFVTLAFGSGDRLLAVWNSYNQDGSQWGVFGQLFGTGPVLPDLVPLSASAPRGANLGDSIALGSEIRNQGNAGTGSFSARYYVSLDPVIASNDTPLGDAFSIGPLDAMGTATDNRSIVIGEEFAPGDYFLGVLLDSSGEVAEADESNNGVAAIAFARINIAPPLSPLSGELRVNTTTMQDQYAAQMDADSNGDYVVVWHGANQRGYGTNDAFFQRFNSLGTPLGSETQVHTDWRGEQVYPDVAVAPNGRFAVVYESPDGTGQGVYLRRFDANGVPLADPVRVNADPAGNQSYPRVAMADDGSLVVTWQDDSRDGSSWGIFAQRFNADGSRAGLEFRANTTTANEQSTEDVAMAGSGQFVIVWHDNAADGSGYGIFGQRYGANGTPVGGEFQVNEFTNSHQWYPSVAMGSDGRIAVAWQSYEDGSDQGIYARRFDVNGSPSSGEFRVNSYTDSTQSNAFVSFAPDDRFVVAWQSYQDGSDYGVYAQRYGATGSVVGGESRLNTYTSSTQDWPKIAYGSGDRLLAVWDSIHQDGSSWGVFGQLYGTGLGQPDLLPLTTSSPRGANLGDNIAVASEFRNQGSAAAGSFAARYYLSLDPLITTDDTPLGGPFSIESLDATTSGSDSRNVLIDANVAPGDYYVGLLLDSNSDIVEANEANNDAAAIAFARINIAAPLTPLGGELRVNSTIGGDQYALQLDTDANGNFVAVWYGANALGYGTSDVFFQRFNSLGTPLGPETSVHNDWPGEQLYPDVAVAPDGHFAVVYETPDGAGQGVYLRQFDASGAPLADPIRVHADPAGTQNRPHVAMADDGSLVVVWQDDTRDGSSWGAYGQRFNANGSRAGSEFRVNTTTANEQSGPDVAMDATGRFVIVWHDSTTDGSGYGLFGQRYAANGAPTGSEFQVNTYSSSHQWFPSVAMGSDGRFAVAWQSYQDGSDQGIYVRRYDASGTPLADEFPVNTYTDSTQANAYVTFASDNRFVVAWQSYQDGSDYGVYAQRYSATGAAVGGEFQLNTYTNSTQDWPKIVYGAGDRLIAAWDSIYQDGSSWGVFGQQFGSGLSQPDLLPLRTDAPMGANLNATITVSSVVRNQGTAAGAFSARYFLSTDAVITAGDIPLGGPFTIDGVEWLSTVADSHEVQVPVNVTPGLYYLGLLVDTRSDITESDESNNATPVVRTARIRIDPAPRELGGESRINRSQGGDQVDVVLDGDDGGNLVAAWHGTNRDGFGTNDIYFQRLNSLGTPLGGERPVHDGWVGEQTNPDIAVRPDGGFIVVYESPDASGSGVYLRRFDALGQPLGAPRRVNTFVSGNQQSPTIGLTNSGAFVVTWQSDQQDGSSWGVFAQRFDSLGNPQDTEFQVNSFTNDSQAEPDVSLDNSGRFVIVWHGQSQDGSGHGIFGQRYSSTGAPLGTEFQVNTFTSYDQIWPSIDMESDGDFVVVWESANQDGSSNAVFGQRFAANGTVRGGEFLINTHTADAQGGPNVAVRSDGSFLVSWHSQQDGSGYGVFAQRFDGAGAAVGGEFHANTESYSDQVWSAVALGNGDRFTIAWQSYAPDGSSWNVALQTYGTDGTQPDLIPVAVGASMGAQLRQSIGLSAEIRNQGAADSAAFTARYYLSADATISASDVPLGDPFSVDNLAPFTTYSDQRRVALPDVAAGDWYVGLVVDPGNAVVESIEDNNNYQPVFSDRTINIQPLPQIGPERRVNSTINDHQSDSDGAMDQSGNHVVVWTSSNQDGSGNGILAQRWNSIGERVGSEFSVNTTTAGHQSSPNVAMAPDGRFVVVWTSENQDGNGYGVFAQRFDTVGNKIGDEFLVNTHTIGDQTSPDVAIDATGKFMIVWQSYSQDSGNNWGVYGQRFQADGTPDGSESWLATDGGPNQMRPVIDMNGAGEFVVSWDDDYTVWARPFEADGTARGDERVVHDYSDSQQFGSSIAIDASGKFVVAWHSYGADGSSWGVEARRFAASGAPTGDEFRVNSYTSDEQSWPSVDMAADGAFVIAWQSLSQDGSSYGIFAQRYSPSGAPFGGEFRINTRTDDQQSGPAIAVRDRDRFWVGWDSLNQDGSGWGVYSQLVGISGENSRANLVPTLVQVPTNVELGQQVEVTLAIRNTGIAAAGPSTARLFLSDDNLADNADDIDLGVDVAIPSLLEFIGADTFQTTARFTWPGNDPFGTDRNYAVVVVADKNQVLDESDETDNSRLSGNLHLLMPNLTVSNLSVPSNINPGQQVSATINVYNNGDSTAAPSVAHLWISDDNVAGNADDIDLFLDVSVPQLPPFQSFQNSVNFTWPVNDPYGTDRSYFVIGRSDVASAVVEFSEQDNARASNSMHVRLPDLTAQVVSGPSGVESGGEVAYQVRIRNAGDLAAPASKARVYLSDGNNAGGGGEYDLMVELAIPALNPNATYDANATFTWPAEDPFGTDLQYHVAARADSADEVRESNENNNWGASFTVELLVPDLTIGSIRTPTTVSNGMQVAAAVRIDNVGADKTDLASVGRVWLSDNNLLGDADDIDLGITFDIPLIEAHESETVIVQAALPAADPFGTDGEYHLLFRVDTGNVLSEANENNNLGSSAPLTWVEPIHLEIALAGHLGGASLAVAAVADYAYELTSAGLRVTDVSNPDQLTRVGELLFTTVPERFDVTTAEVMPYGDHVIVADARTWRVIDITSPAQPVERWRFDSDSNGYLSGMALVGDRLFAATRDQLMVYSLGTPDAPVELGHYDIPGPSRGLAIQNNLAYLLYTPTGFEGTVLESVNVTNPAAPGFVGRRLLSGDYSQPVVRGDLLGLVMDASTLQLFDISDPALPRARGQQEFLYRSIADMAFHGEDLAILHQDSFASHSDTSLVLMDVSDPFDPAVISAQELGSNHAHQAGLGIQGDMAFAANGSLAVVSIANRYDPVPLGLLSEPFGLTQVAAAGGLASALAGGSLDVSAIDVSQPSLPILRGVLDDSGQDSVRKLLSTGGLVIEIKPGSDNDRVSLIDVSDPANPTVAATYPVDDGSSLYDQVLDAQVVDRWLYLYVRGDGERRLEIVDLADPFQPVRTGVIAFNSTSTIGSRDLLAVADGVAAVTNAFAPVLGPEQSETEPNGDTIQATSLGSLPAVSIGRGDITSGDTDVYRIEGQAGDRVWIRMRGEGPTGGNLYNYVQLLNASGDPVAWGTYSTFAPSPSEIAEFTLPDTGEYFVRCQDVYSFYTGEYRLEIAAVRNVALLDVSNPEAPAIVGSLQVDQPIRGLAASANNLFAALNEPPLLQAFDLADPSHPDALGTAQIETAGDLQVGGNLVYLQSGQSVQFVDVADPRRPVTLETYATSLPVSDLAVEGGLLHVLADSFFTLSVRPSGVAAPDLAVTDIVTPAAVQIGQPFTVQWTVRNHGRQTAPGGSWNDQVFLSADARLDAADLALGVVRHHDELPPLATYPASLESPSSAILAGSYFVIVQTDVDDEVNEWFVEANNTRVTGRLTVFGYPDLAVTHVSAPILLERGQPLNVSWIVKNRGEAPADNETWTDTVYLSPDTVLDATDVTLTAKPRNSGLGAGTTYTNVATIDTSTIDDGLYYLLVETDSSHLVDEAVDGINNVGHSPAIRIGTPDLPIGQSIDGEFDGTDSYRYYRINSTAGAHLFVTLDDTDNLGYNELYLRRGAPPTRSEYDARSTRGVGADQQLDLPDADAGPYYVLVYGAHVPASSLDYTITAGELAFSIQGLTPTSVGNSGVVTLTIRGTDFEPSIRAQLVSTTGTAITQIASERISPFQLISRFDLTGISPGTYDLKLHDDSGAFTQLDDVVNVAEGVPGHVWTQLVVPDAVRLGRTFPVTLMYGNDGGGDVEAPLLNLQAYPGTDLFLPDGTNINSRLYEFLAVGNQWPVGAIAPGQAISLSFEAIWRDANLPPAILAWDSVPEQQRTVRDMVAEFGGNPDSAPWSDVVADLTTRFGSTHGEYVAELGRVATRMHTIGLGNFSIVNLLTFAVFDSYVRVTSEDSGSIASSSEGEGGTGVCLGAVISLPSDFSTAGSRLPDGRWVPYSTPRLPTAAEIADFTRCVEADIRLAHLAFLFDSSRCELTKWLQAWLRGDGTFPPYQPTDKFSKDVLSFLQGSNQVDWFQPKLEEKLKALEPPVGSSVHSFSPPFEAHQGVNFAPQVLPTPWRVSWNFGAATLFAKVNRVDLQRTNDESKEVAGDRLHYKATDVELRVEDEFIIREHSANSGSDGYKGDLTNVFLPFYMVNTFGAAKGFQWVVNMKLPQLEGEVILAGIVADAGADRTVTLTGDPCGTKPAETSTSVTLSGSVKQVVDVIPLGTFKWSGSPDPADVASPTVKLNAGTHTFTLRVEANKLVDGKYKKYWDEDQVVIKVLPYKKPENVKCPRPVRSFDPNDKIGVSGYGDQRYIVSDQPMPYTIYYENDPEKASAAAQIVRVVDQLDADMDWSTFELGPMTLFGDYTVAVPPGLSFYETTVDLRPEGMDLLVHVTAGLDPETGIATWLYESLDPATLAPPDDPFAGFLAVNDKALHNGEGHLAYTLHPKRGLASGTQLHNQANNYFDDNEPVATPTTLHTIDAGNPTSHVLPLPAQVPDAPFTVSWSGTDDTGGSGVGTFTVYVARDGGAWEVWLQDTPATSAEFTPVGGHRYDFLSIARDNVGHVEAAKTVGEAQTDVDFSQLRVDQFTIGPAGFTTQFKRQLDASVLSLYDGIAGNWGESDVQLVGERVGVVLGSLLYDASSRTATFLKTGGPLEADNYTLTLRSGADAFRDLEGHLLDGDQDGVAGGDFVRTFTVQPSTAPVLGIPDFARGPGQSVDVPATGSGIPILLSDGTGALGVEFTLTYDPRLLTVRGVDRSSQLPEDWQIGANLGTPGHVVVAAFGTQPLPAGERILVYLDALIPDDATYSAAHLLDLHDVRINEGALPAIDDDGLAVVAYFGDVTANHRLSALDAAYIARTSVGLDTGFAAYRLKDPRILADVTGHGELSALDASYVARRAVGLAQGEVPDLPLILPPIVSGGPDPLVDLPDDLVAVPGGKILAPIRVSDAAGLQALDLEFTYDPAVFELDNTDIGTSDLTRDWTVVPNIDPSTGRVRVAMYGVRPLAAGAGSVLDVIFQVRALANLTPTGLDLLDTTQLNEGQLVVTLNDASVDVSLGTVRGKLFDDRDGDGTQSSQERSLAGWTVFIDVNGDRRLNRPQEDGLCDATTTEPCRVTDIDGIYEFAELFGGQHAVLAVVRPGWTAVTPAAGEYELAVGLDGALFEGLDFMYADKTPPEILDLPEGVTIDAESLDGARVTFTPPRSSDQIDAAPTLACTGDSGANFPLGDTLVRCTASDESGNTRQAEFTITVLSNPYTWNNRLDGLLVDNDAFVAPLDALLVINELNEASYTDGNGHFRSLRPADAPRLDTNRDGLASVIDVLLVINFLNGEAEGEVVQQAVAEPRSTLTSGDVAATSDVAIIEPARRLETRFRPQPSSASNAVAIDTNVPRHQTTDPSATSPIAGTPWHTSNVPQQKDEWESILDLLAKDAVNGGGQRDP